MTSKGTHFSQCPRQGTEIGMSKRPMFERFARITNVWFISKEPAFDSPFAWLVQVDY